MSSTGDESVLPIDFNGSLDPSQLPNVTLGNHSIMQAQAAEIGHPPKQGMSPTGRLSPGKGRTMKEYDQQISLLKKENFSLKMRIFYMEDRMQQQYGGNQDVFKTNIELQVQVETLKKDLAEKQGVIQRASQAMEMLTSNQQQDEESIRQKCESEYLGLLENLKSEVEKREKECEKIRHEAQALRGRVGELEAELKSSNQSKKDMTQKFENAKCDVQSLTGQLKLSQQSLKDTELEKNAAVDHAKKLEKQMQELNQQLARKDRDIQDKCQDQKEEIDDHLRTIAGLEETLKAKDDDIQNLEDKLNKRDKALTDANQELEEREKEMSDKSSLLDRYKKSTEGVFRKLMEKEKLCKSMTDKLQKWKEQYTELEKAHKELKAEKDQVQRESLVELAEMNRDKERLSIDLQETKFQLENVIQCLGRREGELSRFQEQLKTAMEALTQSENAVEELQAQLKAERAEYDSKLRQQALQLSLSVTEDTDDEMASLKRKVKDLQNLIADQNVVNLALGREKAELEKSLAQLNKRNEAIEDLKKEHEAEVRKLEREIQALKLDLSGKDIMLESIQKHPLVVETIHRETLTQIQTDLPKRPTVLDIETIWLDLLEDMKMTLNLLRNEIQSHPAISGQLQHLVKDNATADLLLTEIKSIQKVYHQLEKGVEKNSQLHEALLNSLTSRGTRQSSADSPDSSSCQDGGPSTIPTRDLERDFDPMLLRQQANTSPPATCPFPRQTEQLDRSSQTLPRIDVEELVNRYLQTSKSGSPDRYVDRSAQTSFNTPSKQLIGRSPQIDKPTGEQVNHSFLTPTSSPNRPPQSSTQSVDHRSVNNSKEPLSNSELHLSHLTEKGPPNKNKSSERSLSESKFPSADGKSYQQLSPSSPSLLECTLPCELVTEGRGRRVTFELSGNLGLTDDAKEGHLKKNHCPQGSQLDSFVEEASPDDSSTSLMEVTLVGPYRLSPEEDKSQNQHLDRSRASNGDNASLLRTSLDESTPTFRNISLAFDKERERNNEDERGSQEIPRNCWANELESYRVTEDQDSKATPAGREKTSLSPGQQQQLQRQHQQVIATMSAQELRDLIAQLQQDLIDSVKQNHALKEQILNLKKTSSVNEDQIKQVQDKLHATENTVRYQSIRIKSYKAALDKVGAIGNGHSVPLLSDRSTMSVERARSSQPFNSSLPLALHDNGGQVEGSLTDIQSKDGSPSQSLANISSLSARTRQSSSSLPSGLCFVGTANHMGSDGSSPGRRATNHSSFHLEEKPKDSSPDPRLNSDQGDSFVPRMLSSAADESSILDPTYTSLIDTTLFNKRLSSLDRTTSFGNTTMNVDKLQARITQLEQMNAALKEEIRLVNDLCSSLGIALDLECGNNSKGPYTNARDELLRKHLIEIRQLRQRLERLDLGNDPDQHLIFQTHIHQRIHHQENLIIQLQKQMEEKEEKFHREMTETQHRLQREKSLEMEKAEKVAKKEVEELNSQLKVQEECIQQLQEKCSVFEQRESEINRLKDEKQETEQDLVKRELEILDMEKSLFSLELSKEGLEVKVRQLQTEGEEKEMEIKSLHDQVTDHKESCRIMRDTLLKREDSLREKEFTLQKMSQERSKVEQKIRKQESELNALGQREEELKAELKATRDKKRELELRLVDAEDNCKRKQEAILQANRQMGSLRDKVESADSSLRSCQEDLRSCQEDLRSCQEDLRSCQENLRSSQENARSCQDSLRVCQDNLKAKEQKLMKREKQLNHLIGQYKKLDVAYTKLQYKLEEKSVTVNSLKRVNSLYEAASKQDASEDLMQSLLQELMMTKRQVADLLAKLQTKSNTQPSTDSSSKTTVVSMDDNSSNDSADGKTSEQAAAGMESSSLGLPGDLDQALDQLSASMHERLDADGNMDDLLQPDNRASYDPVLKEQNENLRKELTRLQCKYDLLDHKVKEQGSRLQASSVRQKDWEKSLCRQLIKTTRELEQAKENIDCSKKIFQAGQAGSSDQDESRPQLE